MLFIHAIFKYGAICFFLLSGTNLLAQDFELLKIQSAYYPRQTIEGTATESEIGYFEWGAQIAIPQTFRKNNKTILIHKFGYSNVSVLTQANIPLGKVESKNYYHTIIYNLGLIQTLDTNWRLVVNLNPTLASDFRKKISGDDLLFQVNAMAVNTKNEKLMYGFGLAYTTRFGRQVLIPMGLLKYNTRKFALDMLVPNNVSAMIKTPSNIFSYGIKASLNGGVFNNSSEIQTINNIIDEVGYSRLIIGPAITFSLKKGSKHTSSWRYYHESQNGIY